MVLNETCDSYLATDIIYKSETTAIDTNHVYAYFTGKHSSDSQLSERTKYIETHAKVLPNVMYLYEIK